MKINRKNYESYFLDYLDGSLQDQEIRILKDFLVLNPDLSAELDGMEKTRLSPFNEEFYGKEFLKKPDLTLPVSEENIDDFCIAYNEGDLNPEQQIALDSFFINNPGKRNLLDEFAKAYLTPEKEIIFKNKEKLKKYIIPLRREILVPVLSVAAAVTLLFVIYLKLDNPGNSVQSLSQELNEEIISAQSPEGADMITEPAQTGQDNQVINEAVTENSSLKKIRKVKTTMPPHKRDTQDTKKENPGQQRLNPSYQIKLPSVAAAQANIPQIRREQFNPPPTSVTKAKPDEFLSLSEYAREQFKEKVLRVNSGESEKITSWLIADAGINGINKLTGSKMKLEKKTDPEGNISEYSFNSRFISFSTTNVK